MAVQQIIHPAHGAIEGTDPQNGSYMDADQSENEVFASRAGERKVLSKDVKQYLWGFVNGGVTGAALSVPASAFGDPAQLGRRIFDETRAAYLEGAWVTPDEVAARLAQRGEQCDTLTELEEWNSAAAFVLEKLTTPPDGVSNQTTPTALVDFAATKLTPLLPKRAHRGEPTRDEIIHTAQAVQAEEPAGHQIGEKRSDEIPKAALMTGEKPEYESFQLRQLLYPDWQCQALDTEAAHAERAASHIGRNILYCPELGFLHFNASAGYWKRDDKDGTLTAAKMASLAPVVRVEAGALLKYAAVLAVAARDTDARAMSRSANGLLSHVRKIEQQAFLSGSAKFLAAQRRAEIQQFAPQAWQFAFKNHVFDRGEWRSAAREDYLLGTSPVELDRACDRGEWHQLLRRITGGDAELQRSLQDVAAYALSGASSLRVLAWCYGSKGTGKSTFCELLQTLLGDAGTTLDTAYLSDSSSRERLGAKLWNKRAAFVAEAGNKRIDAELLKTLSGGDTLDVRFLYKESFNARPSHALFLAANDAPRTDAYDDALKDRVMALPFVHRLADGQPLRFQGHARIESARQDAKSALLRGFAAWTADGLEQLYRKQEIYRASAVTTATARFWEETDPLTPFWETISPDALRDGIPKGSLRSLYEDWCDETKERPQNRIQWARACAAHGLLNERRNGEQRTEIWRLP